MSQTLETVKALVAATRVRTSMHGFERLLKHDIDYVALLENIHAAVVIEDYPHYAFGLGCSFFKTTRKGGQFMRLGAIQTAKVI